MFGVPPKYIVYIIIGLIVLVIAILILYLFLPDLSSGLKSLKMDAAKKDVDKIVKEIEGIYENKCEPGDAGVKKCDTYQTSIMIAKIIDGIWKNCYKQDWCDDIMPEFMDNLTDFFEKHPVEVDYTDCNKYSLPECVKKKYYVEEWTVTVWGLRQNTNLCTDEFRDTLWENKNCEGDDYVSDSNNKCNKLCGEDKDRLRDGNDNEKWSKWFNVGNTIKGNIEFKYDASKDWDPLTYEKIKVTIS